MGQFTLVILAWVDVGVSGTCDVAGAGGAVGTPRPRMSGPAAAWHLRASRPISFLLIYVVPCSIKRGSMTLPTM
ncbi:unnamed protein product [Pieris brassicae]|uniref:Secreted protein n=1 Tax=Pieris brassicae TaxID=7116 RepID=A0A9P0TCN2_PIEBR|nr:unnamed protein product [Pieris brassicae]